MIWLRSRTWAYVLTAFLCFNRTANAAEPRLALIMGVGDYTGTKFQVLPGIDKDLQKMESALKATGFDVTVVENPTLGAAENAIEAFGAKLKEQGGGVGLFYFSGHGGEFEGKNYLIPKGARIGDLRDIKEQAVAAQRILNRMEAAATHVNIVFLDCCRNDLTKAATDSGLAPMSAKGTFIGFATGTDKSSVASSDGSPYTDFLAKRLLTPGVSILDMHTQVTADVEDFTKALGAEQTPFQYSGLRSTFFFVPGPPRAEMTKLPPTAAAPRVEMVPAKPESSLTGTTSGAALVNSLDIKRPDAKTRARKLFGLQLQDLTPKLNESLGIEAGSGVLVAAVDPHSPAEAAGFITGLVVQKLGRFPVTSSKQVEDLLGPVGSGSLVDFTLSATRTVRGQKVQQVQTVVLTAQ